MLLFSAILINLLTQWSFNSRLHSYFQKRQRPKENLHRALVYRDLRFGGVVPPAPQLSFKIFMDFNADR